MIGLNGNRLNSKLNYRNYKEKIYKMFKSNPKLNSSKESGASNQPQIPDPNLLIKEGYITKLKSKKRRYFALYTENDHEFAHLDYYENEKKFKSSPSSYKRSIILNDCFAVIKKHDPRFKKSNIFVFAIYTRDDCFSLMFDNQEEMNCWFSLINEVHLKSLAKNKKNAIHDYDKIWYAVIKDKKSVIKGSFYLCLTSEEIHLYKINNSRDKNRTSSSSDSNKDVVDQQTLNLNQQANLFRSSSNDKTDDQSTNSSNNTLDVLRFPFSLIRSFGHQSNNLFIHLGRSSDIGCCQLWFELKDCDTSKHIHSLVANNRNNAKNNEFRTRSNSENNRIFSRRNKQSISDKQNVANQTHSLSNSQSNTSTSINQQLMNPLNSKSSSSLKFNSGVNFHKFIHCEKTKNDKENSTEYVASPIAYSSVAYTTLPSNHMPLRSRSTSESSSCQTAAQLAQSKGFQNLYKTKHLLSSQSSNSNLKSSSNILFAESTADNEEEASDYYMTTPTQQIDTQPLACIEDKESDYLMVEESSREDRTYSTVLQSNKLDNIKKSDLKVHSKVPFGIENAQHYKQLHKQYYSPPVNNSILNTSFVELIPDPVVEELENETDQVDEYVQVELGNDRMRTNQIKENKEIVNKLEVISSEPSSSSSTESKPINIVNEQLKMNNLEDEDYIGIESFSSANTATNQETENFEASNLSPISSTSCNINRVKTFSTSSNNTSNNELNSLGTSPSILSNAFYGQTPINHSGKEEVYKLEKVKSYFNSTEEDSDYIKPARTYSIGSRPQLASFHKIKHAHCASMTKSNTINGPSMSNNSLILFGDASNKQFNKKLVCGHINNCILAAGACEQACTHHLDDNLAKDSCIRIRAYSMGSHSSAISKRELLRKIKLNDFHKKQETNTLNKQIAIEDEETDTSEKCHSIPNIDKEYARKNRSSTLTSFASTASASSSKTVNEESSNEEEDDLMMIDLSKSAPRENEQFSYSHDPISIKEKLKEIKLDSDVLK